jgi:hypothetical protein
MIDPKPESLYSETSVPLGAASPIERSSDMGRVQQYRAGSQMTGELGTINLSSIDRASCLLKEPSLRRCVRLPRPTAAHPAQNCCFGPPATIRRDQDTQSYSSKPQATSCHAASRERREIDSR